MSLGNCERCRWVSSSDEVIFFCHYYPPSVFLRSTRFGDDSYVTKAPMVKRSHWCSFYEEEE